MSVCVGVVGVGDGKACLMHMAFGSQDNVKPQDAGASESERHLHEAGEHGTPLLAVGFSSLRFPIPWPSMSSRPILHTFQ